jgi:hypothetical protein
MYFKVRCQGSFRKLVSHLNHSCPQCLHHTFLTGHHGGAQLQRPQLCQFQCFPFCCGCQVRLLLQWVLSYADPPIDCPYKPPFVVAHSLTNEPRT